MFLDKLGGRKFLLSLIVIATATAVQILSVKGVDTAFASLLIGIVAAFGASNAFVTHKALQAEAGTDEEATDVALPPDLTPDVSALKAQAEQHAQMLAALQQGVSLAQNAAKAALTARVSQ